LPKTLYTRCYTYNALHNFDKDENGNYDDLTIDKIIKEKGDDYLIVEDGLISKKGRQPSGNTFILPTMIIEPPGYWKADIIYSSINVSGAKEIEAGLRSLYAEAKKGTTLFFPKDGIGLYPSLFCIDDNVSFLKFNKIISDFFIPEYIKFEDPSTWETVLSMRKLSEVHSLIGEMVSEGRHSNEKIFSHAAEEVDFEITMKDINNWVASIAQ